MEIRQRAPKGNRFRFLADPERVARALEIASQVPGISADSQTVPVTLYLRSGTYPKERVSGTYKASLLHRNPVRRLARALAKENITGTNPEDSQSPVMQDHNGRLMQYHFYRR